MEYLGASPRFRLLRPLNGPGENVGTGHEGGRGVKVKLPRLGLVSTPEAALSQLDSDDPSGVQLKLDRKPVRFRRGTAAVSEEAPDNRPLRA